jgi:hypothetical protein
MCRRADSSDLYSYGLHAHPEGKAAGEYLTWGEWARDSVMPTGLISYQGLQKHHKRPRPTGELAKRSTSRKHQLSKSDPDCAKSWTGARYLHDLGVRTARVV